MQKLLVYILFHLSLIVVLPDIYAQNTTMKTICNPLNISYRFCTDEPSRREAADPTVVWFRDRFYLFASKSGGYWHSKDLAEWIFIETDQIPVEEYAPTAIIINDTVYFLASSGERSTIYKSADPLSGDWSVAVPALEIPVWDPAFFLDEDGRLYLYWGCSNENPIYGVEVDYENQFSFIGQPSVLIYASPETYGWEVPGDYNTLVNQKPWIEGAWVSKMKGKYYLQYSGPGTEYKSYADGIYIAEKPLGPYKLQHHNPFAYKPDGFAAGAGHGSSFSDQYGNFWHIGTMTISQKHIFERRLGLFPAFLDQDGTFYANTKFGDYPLGLPQKKISDFRDIFPGWMLLSYRKQVVVSSELDSFPASGMVDEDIRTAWVAQSGDAGEFAVLDLGESCDVHAVQINFAEHNTDIFGRNSGSFHRYILECSEDGDIWKMMADRSSEALDNTHEYIQLDNKLRCRFIRIKNIKVPAGHFAISGLRVFGKGNGKAPERINNFQAERDASDRRKVRLRWTGQNAIGFNILYGSEKDKLYSCFTVYDSGYLEIRSLHADLGYYFAVEPFNENGFTRFEEVIYVQ